MRAELETAVAELRKGNAGALEQALALIQRTAYSFSMKVCGHREDAEDTAQETLLRAVRQLPRFDSPKALAVWLYKVARSRCLMSRRRSKFAPRHEISLDEVLPDRRKLETAVTDGGPSPERHLLRKESSRELRSAIDRLPPDYRIILVLHDMEELETEEVARITGLKPGTVRVRLHRARAFLRNELARGAGREGRSGRCRPSQQCRQLFASLSDYLDKELDEAALARIEAHLGGCKPCEAYLASLEETIRRCRRHCPEPMKARLASRIREAIRRAQATR